MNLNSSVFKIIGPILVAFLIFRGLKEFFPAHDFSAKKLAHFASQKDDVDLIFLGSSLTYRGIDPEVFDQTIAKQAIGFRSFNLGAPNQSVAQSLLLTQALLDLKPKKLKWVILDINSRFAETNFGDQASLAWHTFEETLFLSKYILASKDSLFDQLILIGRHWLDFIWGQVAF
jgi:hypothetical protein